MAGNIRVGGAYTPGVRNPFVEQPAIRGNTAPFEAGINAAEKVSKLGFTLMAKAEDEANKEQNFLAQKSFLDEATAAQGLLNDKKNNASLGDPNFTQNIMGEFEKRHADLLAKAQATGMDSENLKKFDLQLQDLRKTIQANSLTFQNASRGQYLQSQTNDAVKKLGQLVFSDPTQVAGAQKELHDLIENMTGVDALDKDKLFQEAWSGIALMAGFGMAQQNPQGVVDSLGPKQASGSLIDVASMVIRGEEGFQPSAKWDVDHDRLGYGSDTITRADGSVVSVKAGDVVSREDAERDLNRRLPQFIAAAKGKVGANWDTLPVVVQAALTSVEYNYKGGLSNGALKGLVAAAQSGNALAVADALDALPDASPDKNIAASLRNRRHREAQLIRTGVYSRAGGGKTGNPILDNLTGPQQLQVLNTAQADVNKQTTNQRATLDVIENNAKAAYLTSGIYNGPLPTSQQYDSAYGPVIGQQKWAEFLGLQQQGEFIRTAGTLSPGDMDARLASMKPGNTADPTFGEQQAAWANSVKARDALVDARNKDPVTYVSQHFPAVKVAAAAMVSGNSPNAGAGYYAALAQAYKQIDLPMDKWAAFSDSALSTLKTRWDTLPPDQKVTELAGLKQVTGEMFDVAMNQLFKNGHAVEAYIASAVSENPAMFGVMTDALRGLSKITGPNAQSALKPDDSKVDEAFLSLVGQDNLAQYQNTMASKAIKDLAVGLYIQHGGNPSKGAGNNVLLTGQDFGGAVRAVVGGSFDNPDTGFVNMGQGNVMTKTLLPPGITKQQFTRFKETASDEFYLLAGNGPPRFANGEVVTADQIEKEGVFVRVASNRYMVFMGSDGGALRGGQPDAAEPYYIELTADAVLKEGQNPSGGLGSGGVPESVGDATARDLVNDYEKNYKLSYPNATPQEVKAARDSFDKEVRESMKIPAPGATVNYSKALPFIVNALGAGDDLEAKRKALADALAKSDFSPSDQVLIKKYFEDNFLVIPKTPSTGNRPQG